MKKENKENTDKVDAIVAQTSDDSDTEQISSSNLKVKFSEELKSIYKVLQDKNFTFRTLNGISKQSNLTVPESKAVLKSLIDNGLVITFTRNDGVTLFTLSSEGRKLSLLD